MPYQILSYFMYYFLTVNSISEPKLFHIYNSFLFKFNEANNIICLKLLNSWIIRRWRTSNVSIILFRVYLAKKD